MCACTAQHCNTLQHTATRCGTEHSYLRLMPQNIASSAVCSTRKQHATTLQHTATRGNTVEHAAAQKKIYLRLRPAEFCFMSLLQHGRHNKCPHGSITT